MYAMNTATLSQPTMVDAGFEHYEDTGCEVAETCLGCPLPRCKFDDMAWYSKYRRMARDLRMISVIQDEELTVAEAAARFSVTKRTVFRVVKRCREAMQELSANEIAVFSRLAA
jgi:hypothetical protein